MVDTGYPIATAAADLAAANLLAYVLAPHDGRLTPGRPGTQAGVFRGADLDSRRVRAGQLFVALPGERTDGRRYVAEVVARGVPVLAGLPDGRGGTLGAPPSAPPAPAADDRCGAAAAAGAALLVSPAPRRALQHLAGCWRRRLALRVAGITGSNGKTTTKELLASMVAGAGPALATAGNRNNELGLPLTLLSLTPAHRYAVVEMGASAVGDIARLAALARPEVGVITNAAEAHLAEFGSLDGVVRGKGELLDALPAAGTAVLNADSPGFERWCERAPCRVVSWGRRRGDHRWTWAPAAGGREGRLQLDGEEWPVPLPGPHNGANLCAALLAARAFGIADATLRAGLHAFRAPAHRSRVLQVGGWTVLDDSYNANPTSVAAAAAALLELPGGRALAVLGKMAELGERSAAIHHALGRRLRDLQIDALVAVGADAGELAAGFAAAGGEAHRCADPDAAAAWLVRHAAPGDRILIKGSRAAAMEAILERLRRGAANRSGEPVAGAQDTDDEAAN